MLGPLYNRIHAQLLFVQIRVQEFPRHVKDGRFAGGSSEEVVFQVVGFFGVSTIAYFVRISLMIVGKGF